MAVDDISFEVKKGETIAFIGPNGAGKSTTIKMLTGILYPTSGEIQVAGLNPQKQRKQLAYKIGTVFGQRSQLMFNLPVADSFELFGRMYDLSSKQITKRQDELKELFDLEEFWDQPVRKLSLGQRMRAEIAASLIHNPEIIFLDEPTIGLDVIAKQKLRKTLRYLNEEFQTTIFLTSHDVGDIESLCQRTVVVNYGKIILDMSTEDLKKKYFKEKFIRIHFSKEVTDFNLPNVEIVKQNDLGVLCKIKTDEHALSALLEKIFSTFPVEDIEVMNPYLESIIGRIYKE